MPRNDIMCVAKGLLRRILTSKNSDGTRDADMRHEKKRKSDGHEPGNRALKKRNRA